MATATKSKKFQNKIVKRKVHRTNAIFIDGVTLDRATKRLERKISMVDLKKSLTRGNDTVVCRYYTILPFEDDSRHHSYLGAVARAGFDVVIKRLPPKNMDVQISIAPEMSADIIAYAMGHEKFSDLSLLRSENDNSSENVQDKHEKKDLSADTQIRRIATVVCPTKEIGYALQFAGELKVQTISADFSKTAGRDVLKNANDWIDLGDAEDIWRK